MKILPELQVQTELEAKEGVRKRACCIAKTLILNFTGSYDGVNSKQQSYC